MIKMNAIRLMPAVAVALLAGACSKPATVYMTAASGEKCEQIQDLKFSKSTVDCPNVITVNTADKRQTIDGFGGSLTESSAYVLACVTPEQRKAILNELFSEEGANFSMVRTQIGASDFSVKGLYSLAMVEGDTALAAFSMAPDVEGFSKEEYPLIKDEHYDLYHLMKEVAAIKKGQADQEYRIFANTWTAPAWMKDNNAYYERDYSRDLHRGGRLLPQYYQTYANYLLKYFEFYRNEGIECWGLTPVNEPMGNDGGWESMDFSGPEESLFIADYLAPTLKAAGFDNLHIFGFDQNTFESDPYTAAIYGNPKSKDATTGMALHWYGSTLSCFPNVLDSLHNLYPDKHLLHTEGCIDNLGCPAWDAVQDKEGFQECCWFNNDSFWWTESATDWAYSTPYWPEWHPKYAAAERYAQYIIEGMNHWMTGYIDWNIVLDEVGGPNHVNNFAAAEVMIDAKNDIIYYTPYYYVLKQISRSMRPNDIVLGVEQAMDGVYVCAVEKADGSYAINMLNMNHEEVAFALVIGDYQAQVNLPADALQTVYVAF